MGSSEWVVELQPRRRVDGLDEVVVRIQEIEV